MLLTLHHSVSDGWSTSILCRETPRLYHAARAGTAPDLPPLPIQRAMPSWISVPMSPAFFLKARWAFFAVSNIFGNSVSGTTNRQRSGW